MGFVISETRSSTIPESEREWYRPTSLHTHPLGLLPSLPGGLERSEEMPRGRLGTKPFSGAVRLVDSNAGRVPRWE
jgi:hypothetical protein